MHGAEAAHALGYIREITGAQLERPKYAGYMVGDLVGQYGIERELESCRARVEIGWGGELEVEADARVLPIEVALGGERIDKMRQA